MLQIYAESPSPKKLTTNSSPLKDRRTEAPSRKPQKSSIFRLCQMALRISALKLGCHKKPPLKEPLKKNTQQQKRSSLEAGGEAVAIATRHNTGPLRIWAKSVDEPGIRMAFAVWFGKPRWFQAMIYFHQTEDSSCC